MNDQSQENDTAQHRIQAGGAPDQEQPRCCDGGPPVETLEPQTASTRRPDGDIAGPSPVDECNGETPSDTDGSATDIRFAAQDIMDWLTDFNRRFGDTINDAAGNVPGTDATCEVGETATPCPQNAEDQVPETVEDAVTPTGMDCADDNGAGTVCSNDEDDLRVVDAVALPDEGLDVVTAPSDAVAAEDIPADATMLTASEVFTEVPVPVTPHEDGRSFVARDADPGESRESHFNDDAGASESQASAESECSNSKCHENHRRAGFFARLWARLRGNSQRSSPKNDG